MLELTLPKEEVWIERTQEFQNHPDVKLKLEHSLISISKWEQKHKKPFLSSELTPVEFIDYVGCMSLTPIDDEQLARLVIHTDLIKQIRTYMEDPMTATTFNKENLKKLNSNPGRRDIITNEVIYYWMTELNIPFNPCEKWHINRLFALIQVCNIKKTPGQKMSKSDVYKQNKSLNAARKAARGTKG